MECKPKKGMIDCKILADVRHINVQIYVIKLWFSYSNNIVVYAVIGIDSARSGYFEQFLGCFNL